MSLELYSLIISVATSTLIWLVQLVIYPNFKFIDEQVFKNAMIKHQRSITSIVLPLMMIELFLTIYGLIKNFDLIYLSTFACLVIIWVSTFLIQVPIHQKLLIKKDDLLIQRLIHTNWIRTIFWSLKLILFLFMYHKMF